jgi:hypothetical protein
MTLPFLNLLIFLLSGSFVTEISKIEVDIKDNTKDRFYGEAQICLIAKLYLQTFINT